jgi:hypothetical protein
MAPRNAALVLATAVLLTGCASREEIAAKKAAAERAAQASREARCTSFGYKSGAPDYSRCLESMYLQDQQMAAAKEAEDAARAQRVAAGLQQAGASLSAIGQPPPPTPPPMFNPPVRCNTIGTTTTCQ